ncbi:MAG TPA: cysteine--tRNA ligase [Thermoleophilaceae bacterium]|nr:cysteine--tRNA ligase [Thermoleophilaceae bacterium]
MREIRIHDTLSGAPAPLEPREPRRVRIYACGPTVYAPVHVGNARPFVVFALLKRFLEHEGYEVTLVENVTDVNDKIYAAARAAGQPSDRLAREMAERYVRDTDRLGLGRPDHEPRATEAIAAIVDLIGALIDSGHAYAAAGDVYFRVRSFPHYGKLSNRALEDMVQTEGDEARADLKESPQDFALWKARKPDEDTAWPTPWGEGRPGWHIECSAMAESILGLDFDIHGGGIDLVFPHHENEIAQTEAGRGRPLARIWMHNGMIELDEEKMSKSEGRIHLLGEALDRYGRDPLVMYLVGGHYRQPLAFSPEALEDAARAVERVRDFCRRLEGPDQTGPEPAEDPPALRAHAERFYEALADDFNTPAARAALFEWVAEGHRLLDAGRTLGRAGIVELLWTLGLEGLAEPGDGRPSPEAQRLLEEREAARAGRDYSTADARREELLALGWEVRDTPEGPRLVARP